MRGYQTKMSYQIDCAICQSKMSKMFEYQTFDYLRCPECKHVVTLPFPTQYETNKHYERGFEEANYNVARKHGDIYKYAMSKLVLLIRDYFNRQTRSLNELSILDVGCFTGDFLCCMEREGARVCGIEMQEKAAKIANQRLPAKIINADVLSGDFSLPQDRFDLISIVGVIEHVIDPICLIERVTSWLNKDGLLVIQTPNSSSIVARTMGKFWPPYTPVEHIHLFSQESLLCLLDKFGFRYIIFKPHWKTLSISYVYSMFETFGPELHKILKPIYKISPKFIVNKRLPFYGGEMIVLSSFSKPK